MAHLTATVEAVIESSEQIPADDEHDPDGSTIAFERAQVAALLRDARTHLEDLDRADERLRAGAYGICTACGEPIAAERLGALPAVATCVRCTGANTGALPWRRAPDGCSPGA